MLCCWVAVTSWSCPSGGVTLLLEGSQTPFCRWAGPGHISNGWWMLHPLPSCLGTISASRFEMRVPLGWLQCKRSVRIPWGMSLKHAPTLLCRRCRSPQPQKVAPAPAKPSSAARHARGATSRHRTAGLSTALASPAPRSRAFDDHHGHERRTAPQNLPPPVQSLQVPDTHILSKALGAMRPLPAAVVCVGSRPVKAAAERRTHATFHACHSAHSAHPGRAVATRLPPGPPGCHLTPRGNRVGTLSCVRGAAGCDPMP